VVDIHWDEFSEGWALDGDEVQRRIDRKALMHKSPRVKSVKGKKPKCKKLFP
jgi:hypothetical protein